MIFLHGKTTVYWSILWILGTRETKYLNISYFYHYWSYFNQNITLRRNASTPFFSFFSLFLLGWLISSTAMADTTIPYINIFIHIIATWPVSSNTNRDKYHSNCIWYNSSQTVNCTLPIDIFWRSFWDNPIMSLLGSSTRQDGQPNLIWHKYGYAWNLLHHSPAQKKRKPVAVTKTKKLKKKGSDSFFFVCEG